MPQLPLDTRQSHDLPDVLIHLTHRSGPPSPGLPSSIEALDPWERQAAILSSTTVRYGRPFDTEWPVACFTQTTRRALYGLSRYQHTGVAFHKQQVWDAGGGPVSYVRGDRWTTWSTSNLPEPLKSMGVRLWPGWDGLPSAENFFSDETRARSEWLHEREWRLPSPSAAGGGWKFSNEAVAFLVCVGPKVRDLMLQSLDRFGGDRPWVESLPVAYPDAASESFVGVGNDIWV